LAKVSITTSWGLNRGQRIGSGKAPQGTQSKCHGFDSVDLYIIGFEGARASSGPLRGALYTHNDAPIENRHLFLIRSSIAGKF
jgi:hypothetical protein